MGNKSNINMAETLTRSRMNIIYDAILSELSFIV
jgi:hypothetical protein